MSDHWTDDFTRVDGVKIKLHPDEPGAWVVIGRGGSIDHCPCCDKPMASIRAAQLVADIVYPVLRPAA